MEPNKFTVGVLLFDIKLLRLHKHNVMWKVERSKLENPSSHEQKRRA